MSAKQGEGSLIQTPISPKEIPLNRTPISPRTGLSQIVIEFDKRYPQGRGKCDFQDDEEHTIFKDVVLRIVVDALNISPTESGDFLTVVERGRICASNAWDIGRNPLYRFLLQEAYWLQSLPDMDVVVESCDMIEGRTAGILSFSVTSVCDKDEFQEALHAFECALRQTDRKTTKSIGAAGVGIERCFMTQETQETPAEKSMVLSEIMPLRENEGIMPESNDAVSVGIKSYPLTHISRMWQAFLNRFRGNV